MSIKSQKILNFWENYYPLFISIIITLVFYFGCKSTVRTKIFSKEIISVTITISGILFGFLLTILALLMQSDNNSMKLIKVYGRFGELIKFNKRAVYSSALSLILSLIFLVVIDTEPIKCFYIHLFELFKWLWFFVLVMTILKTFRYVDIFYSLIKE